LFLLFGAGENFGTLQTRSANPSILITGIEFGMARLVISSFLGVTSR